MDSHITLPINHGHPWSPYLVFIRRTDLSDADLLCRLGKQSFVDLPKLDVYLDYIAIGRDSNWTHLADCWGYTNWYSKHFRECIRDLASESDVFCFSVGECDMSFDFELHQNGELTRRLVWEDHNFDGGTLKEQVGAPLEGESLIPMGSDPLAALWNLAANLGIETDYSRVRPKLYAAPKPKEEPAKPPAGWFRSLFAWRRP